MLFLDVSCITCEVHGFLIVYRALRFEYLIWKFTKTFVLRSVFSQTALKQISRSEVWIHSLAKIVLISMKSVC